MLRRRSRGVAQFSQHTLGKAIDFNINGAPVDRLREIAMRLQRGGVGFYPGSFVHVDVGSVRHWPRMGPDQLARLFPNGRTVHIPSNGQPLSGYALALADIEKRGGSMPSSMSLASARNAGAIGDEERVERVASAGKPKKGNFFAQLFGFSTDDEEDEDQPVGNTVVAKARRKPPAARVPLPQARPQIQVAARDSKGGGFALASATSTPFDTQRRAARRARRRRSPTRQVHPARRRPPASIRGSRMPRRAPTACRPISRLPTRPRPFRKARAPLRPRRRCRASAAEGTSQIARIPPKAGQRFNDPWLRGITLASSVHYGMNVSVYGKLDVRQVRTMMIKPVSSLMMAFGGDPYEGMQTARFARRRGDLPADRDLRRKPAGELAVVSVRHAGPPKA